MFEGISSEPVIRTAVFDDKNLLRIFVAVIFEPNAITVILCHMRLPEPVEDEISSVRPEHVLNIGGMSMTTHGLTASLTDGKAMDKFVAGVKIFEFIPILELSRIFPPRRKIMLPATNFEFTGIIIIKVKLSFHRHMYSLTPSN